MSRWFIGCALLGLWVLAPGWVRAQEPEKKADAATSDAARLQGTWIGQVANGPPGSQVTMTVRGDQAEFKGANPVQQYKGKLVLHPAANPKQIDFVVQECSAAQYVGKSSLGIYKLDEDGTLTLAANEPGVEARPPSFQRAEGTAVFLFKKGQLGGDLAPPSELLVPAARSPEQKALDAFLGTWRSEGTLFQAEGSPETKPIAGRQTTTRILGGQFVQERAEEPRDEHLTLYTYDTQRKAYRAWWFNWQGQSNEFTGKWDPAARAFTWTAPAGEGRTATAQHRFVGDDAAVWSVVVKDDAGKVYFRMEGKNTRMR